MKKTRKCVRINDAVYIFKLPASLLRRIRTAAKRERVSVSKLVRTAVIRLLADLAAGKGKEIVWR